KRRFSGRGGARPAPSRSAEAWHTSTNEELPILTKEVSFGRALPPAYTIKTPSLAKRFQLSKKAPNYPRLASLRFLHCGSRSTLRRKRSIFLFLYCSCVCDTSAPASR